MQLHLHNLKFGCVVANLNLFSDLDPCGRECVKSHVHYNTRMRMRMTRKRVIGILRILMVLLYLVVLTTTTCLKRLRIYII